MDSYIKTGEVYLQPHKAGKKWKPVLLSLFPPSSSGVGRLEIQDVGGGGTGGDHGGTAGRRHLILQPHGDRRLKVVRLSALISVLRLPPNAEACPMENMSAFCIEAQDRTMVFAALKEDCVDWVEKLCQSTFQRGGEAGGASTVFHMEENQIYASADDASDFWVVVQRTDAAARCGLQGSHWLQVGREVLRLKDTQTKSAVREWPYELLRRYGKDKMTLTIEAGRRCDSGPGTFTFETQQAEKIFALIQSTIRRKTVSAGHQNQEVEKANVTNIQAHSPLPRTPDVTGVTALLEKDLRTEEDVVAHAQPAPITLMPLPLVPTEDGASGGHLCDLSDPVYDDPAECIFPVLDLQSSTALYVDPAMVLPLKPPGSKPTPGAAQPCFDLRHPDSDYSEVFDKVNPVLSEGAASQHEEPTKCLAGFDSIYAEPVTLSQRIPKKVKPDPYAHLYAQVCKKKPASSPSNTPLLQYDPSLSGTGGTKTMKDMDQSLDDVIYENLGII